MCDQLAARSCAQTQTHSNTYEAIHLSIKTKYTSKFKLYQTNKSIMNPNLVCRYFGVLLLTDYHVLKIGITSFHLLLVFRGGQHIRRLYDQVTSWATILIISLTLLFAFAQIYSSSSPISLTKHC